MSKIRLDIALVEQGFAASRDVAKRLVIAGKVRVDGQLAVAPSQKIADDASLRVDAGKRFVSRGGEKLAAALDTFPVKVQNRVCADAGASTGGFTDCLLQHGAAKVYAIDVGRGILAWKLRTDSRVVVMEKTNARHVKKLPEAINLAVIDASFISLKVLLPVVKNWLDEAGDVVALVKPQFEATREEADAGKGVIRDSAIHERILREVIRFAAEQGFSPRGLIRSPIQGPKGNIEFLLWLNTGKVKTAPKRMIDEALA
jgi:23S rRNA (cytidine1920-2'-O)/16S rRNA (cytidine1409-2'-O)-methyltransferase